MRRPTCRRKRESGNGGVYKTECVTMAAGQKSCATGERTCGVPSYPRRRESIGRLRSHSDRSERRTPAQKAGRKDAGYKPALPEKAGACGVPSFPRRRESIGRLRSHSDRSERRTPAQKAGRKDAGYKPALPENAGTCGVPSFPRRRESILFFPLAVVPPRDILHGASAVLPLCARPNPTPPRAAVGPRCAAPWRCPRRCRPCPTSPPKMSHGPWQCPLRV